MVFSTDAGCFEAEVGIVKQAGGSSSFSFGDTKVVCTVTGPQKLRREGVTNTHVVWKSSGTASIEKNKYHEIVIGRIASDVIDCSFVPLEGLLISVSVLEDSGDAIHCAINSLYLALVDAGIPIKTTFASVPITTKTHTGEENRTEIVMVTELPEHERILFLDYNLNGKESGTHSELLKLENLLSHTSASYKQIMNCYRQALQNK